MTCWNCDAKHPGQPFCHACGSLQPRPTQATLFDVFGLEPTVDLPQGSLEKPFRELSLKLHPDRFATAEPRIRRYSLEQTTTLNEANKTLRDPVRRAFYLLKLLGVDLDREDAGAQKDMPLEFLEEVMELREQLEGFKARGDLGTAQAMASDVLSRQNAALLQAQASLNARLKNPQDVDALHTAAHALARVRYFSRFLEEVEAMEEESLA